MTELSFFGTEGLTMTSANHVANLAKEFAKTTEHKLNSVSFIETNLTIIGSDVIQPIHTGWCDAALGNITENLRVVCDANALIAWLREAIKAYDKHVKAIDAQTLEEYCHECGVALPEEPLRITSITKEEYIETLTIKERNKILMLQAQAAVYGKYIHPEGSFAAARAELMEKMANEIEVKGNGRDTLLYHYKPTANAMKVEDCFYQLQREYRATQAELNGYLHKIDQAVQKDADEKSKAFHDAMVSYRLKIAELTKKFENYKMLRLEEARKLRIVIPNDLKGIYAIVSELGK